MNKAIRQAVFQKYSGRCAYCGSHLTGKFHVDHLSPIVRGPGGIEKPENEAFENLMPACVPCNLDKGMRPLENWREKLETSCAVLERNSTTYRHALRFGQLVQTPKPIVFYFESVK